MNNVLLINASPNGQVSHANQLALGLVQSLRQRYPRLELVERDLGAHPLPPLGMDYARARLSLEPLFSNLVRSSSVELVQQTVKRYPLLIGFHTIGVEKWRYPCLSKVALYASGSQRKILVNVTDA
jgi:FMN-dependent NADH-azoreductase